MTRHATLEAVMVGKSEGRPEVLLLTWNLVKDVPPNNKLDVAETALARVTTVSNLGAGARRVPLIGEEFEQLSKRKLDSFDTIYMNLGLSEPRFPLASTPLRGLDPAKVVLVISPGLKHLGYGTIATALRMARLAASRLVYAADDDENSVAIMGRIRRQILETGGFGPEG